MADTHRRRHTRKHHGDGTSATPPAAQLSSSQQGHGNTAGLAKLVMGVMVIPSMRANRDAIRATWAYEAGREMLVRFVAGDVPCARKALADEIKRFSDVDLCAYAMGYRVTHSSILFFDVRQKQNATTIV